MTAREKFQALRDWISRWVFPRRWFTCEHCGGFYRKSWSDQEAAAEQAANGWGKIAEEDVAIICDDCYQDFMRWRAQPAGARE